MFAGVIVALIATEAFIKVSNIKKLQVNLGDNVPPAVGKSFNVLIPVIIVVSLFALVSAALFNITGTNIINLITTFIQEPLRHIGTGLWGCIILYSLGNMLWLFGIHQSVIYSSILEPLLIINITENIAAYSAGEAIPNIINVSQVTTYGLMGGSGSTICLLIATFLVGKNAMTKNVAKMSVAPGIFNINEPVTFGLPIVMNPIMGIPFMIAPVVTSAFGYFMTSIGFCGKMVVNAPWTTPPGLMAFMASGGSFGAVITQILAVLISFLIYTPFVLISNKQAEQENSAE